MRTKEESVEFLKWYYRGGFSDLGANVALLLDRMWGLHNINKTSLKKVHWANDVWIDFTCNKPLSTVDSNDLTRLIVIAHEMMLRIELRGLGPGYIRLTFHQRKSRDKSEGFFAWCPTIEDHVNLIQGKTPVL